MAEQIRGLNQTLGVLQDIDPILRREAIKRLKTDAKPIVAAAKSKIPTVALSGWVAPKQTGAPNPRKSKSPIKPYDATAMRRRTTISVRNKRTRDKKGKETLIRLVSAAPTSTPFDMAGKITRSVFADNLSAKFGEPSRFMYPAVEANRDLVISSMRRSVVNMEQLINEALRDKGKLGRSRPRGSAFIR